MIANLHGTLIYKSTTEAIIECGGVGYSAFISVNTYDKLPETGSIIKLNTILIPREDSLNLYGFFDYDEREAFKMLITVSGVGSKVALGILSSLSVDNLQEMILTGNLLGLQKLPGVGRKLAERLVLELRDKITKIIPSGKGIKPLAVNVIRQEAIAALITLGYSSTAAEKSVKLAISEETDENLSAEKIIRKALKYPVN